MLLSEAPEERPAGRSWRLSRSLEEDGSRSALRGRWGLLLYFGGWTLIGLHFAAWIIASATLAETEIPWTLVVSEFLRWYLWALLVPIIAWAAGRYPLRRPRLVGRLALHLGIGIVVSLVFAFLDLVKRELIHAVVRNAQTGNFRFSLHHDWPSMLAWGMEYHLLTYVGIVAVIHAYLFQTRFSDREVKTSRLEAQLALARLEVLKMQLHPHFLFNALNAISALMHRDVDAADRMITKLSDLLRRSLDKDDRHQVSLASELDFLDRYLDIEKIRFRDRLTVEKDIDPACLQAQVPRLILQPLVENSIRHGIAVLSAAGTVSIHARRKGNRLLLAVADDGPGLPSGKPSREGVGLANTRDRLAQLYGLDHSLSLDEAESGGLRVSMEIPYEESPRSNPIAP